MEPAEYDEMLRRLMVLTVSVGTAVEELREFTREQRDINRQQAEMMQQHTTMIQELQAANLRLETLITRMIRTETNGRDA